MERLKVSSVGALSVATKLKLGKAYRKHLHRRSGQEMHVPNCELIRNHVKDRNLACPMNYKVIKEVSAFHELLTR